MAGPNPTRADMLRLINEVGEFTSGTSITFGPKCMTRRQGLSDRHSARGTFKAVEKL